MFCRANYEIIHHLLKETDIGFIYLFICLFIVIYLFIYLFLLQIDLLIVTTNLTRKFNKVEKRGGVL